MGSQPNLNTLISLTSLCRELESSPTSRQAEQVRKGFREAQGETEAKSGEASGLKVPLQSQDIKSARNEILLEHGEAPGPGEGRGPLGLCTLVH